MSPLLFPAPAPGSGAPYRVKLTLRQKARLLDRAAALDCRQSSDGPASIGALIRAIAEGSVTVARRDQPATPPAVHRGCPLD